MGCGLSKPKPPRQDQATPLQNISAPSRPLRMVPQPQRDLTGRPVQYQSFDLTRERLGSALHIAAQYLHRRNRNVTIVTVGGAVNTMLLRTRDTTHDVDFIHGDMQSSEMSLLDQAGREAIERSSVPLGGDWLNNSTALFISRDLVRDLVRGAKEQGDIVFQEHGLTVYAAPWDYAFCTKLDRLTKPTRRPYDPSDARAYLRNYIQRHQNKPVPVQQVKQWAQRYRTAISDQVIQEVDSHYVAKYQAHGICW